MEIRKGDIFYCDDSNRIFLVDDSLPNWGPVWTLSNISRTLREYDDVVSMIVHIDNLKRMTFIGSLD